MVRVTQYPPVVSWDALTYPTNVLPSLQAKLQDRIPGTRRPLEQVDDYLWQEFSTNRLDSAQKHLWLAGLGRQNIRALHRQRVKGRELVIAEDPGLHLVWKNDKIFIKPLPLALLHSQFVEDHIFRRGAAYKPASHAMGFLATYLNLIQHPSDLHIAHKLQLVPDELGWSDWLQFTSQLDADNDRLLHVRYHNRYDRGELRLDRLNWIFIRELPRLYFTIETQYGDYFGPILIITVYLYAFFQATLSAFQVIEGSGVSTPLSASVGYWYGSVVLVLCVAFLAIPFVWFGVLFLFNLGYAVRWLVI